MKEIFAIIGLVLFYACHSILRFFEKNGRLMIVLSFIVILVKLVVIPMWIK